MYCKWHWDVKVDHSGAGSVTSTLVSRNNDQGVCASYLYSTFKINSKDSSGFRAEVINSTAYVFGETSSFNFTYQNNRLSNSMDINIEGYRARREITLIKQ